MNENGTSRRLVVALGALLTSLAMAGGLVRPPSSAGVFVCDGETFTRLDSSEVDSKRLVGYYTRVLIGVRSIEAVRRVADSACLVVNSMGRPVSDWKLTRLDFVQQYQDDLIRREPFDVSMWLPVGTVDCSIEPVEGMGDCFVVRPETELNGVFLLHTASLEPLTHDGVVYRHAYPFIAGEVVLAPRQEQRFAKQPVSAVWFGSDQNQPSLHALTDSLWLSRTAAGALAVLSIKPPASRVRQVVCAATGDADLVALSVAGQLLRSGDSGKSWLRVALEVPSSFLHRVASGESLVGVNVGYLDREVTGSRKLVAGGKSADGRGVLLTNVDNGTSWVAEAVDSEVMAVLMGPAGAVVCSDVAAYRLPKESPVLALSFAKALQRLSAMPPAPEAVVSLNEAVDSLLVIGRGGATHWVSLLNGEMSSRAAVGANCTGCRVVRSGSSIWLVAAGELFRTDDAGVMWSKVSVPAGLQAMAIAVAPGGLMALGTSSGAYVSEDSGKSWSEVIGK